MSITNNNILMKRINKYNDILNGIKLITLSEIIEEDKYHPKKDKMKSKTQRS